MTQLSNLGIWVLTSAVIGVLGATALVVAGVASIWLIVVLPIVVVAETGLFRAVRSGLNSVIRRVKGY